MNKERILVVDDEPGMLRSVERVLASHYPVTTASSAAEALEVAAADVPDLAIVDIRMPERDGFELAVDLRARHPGIDVIFMTGAVHELDSQIVRAIRERAFYFIQKPFDRVVLLTLIERCLELRRLAAENRRYTRRLEAELADARSFQLGMLPEPNAVFPGVTVHAGYAPCTEVGGDLYDYVDAGDGRMAFLVADVSGHGVSAAMLTSIVKAAFHDALADRYAPDDVVRRTASALRPFDMGRFVTLFCGRVSPDEGVLEYVNAGHPAPLHWGPDRPLDKIEMTGAMISPAFPDLGWEASRRELARGDRLLVYTDGIVEARSEDGSFFGEERLTELVEATSRSGEELLGRVTESVREFCGRRPMDDDHTLLTVAVD